MTALVSYQADGQVATITMDDGKVNALSPQMLAELDQAVGQAEADHAVIVLTGRPGFLSAGFDLRVLQAGGDATRAMARAGFELAARLLSYPAPVVVACPGHAIAMGAFLLLSADYRIGADGPYKITANEVAIGLRIPAVVMELARQRVGPAFLSRTLLLAEVFPPAAAVAAGFLDQVVPAGELLAAAQEQAAQLAKLDASAHAATKRQLRQPVVAAMRAAMEADQNVLSETSA